MLELAGIFSDKMILQRNRPCAIWGKEDTSPDVTVSILGESYQAQVQDGRFLVELPPMEACENISIEIEGSNKVVLSDVCFGDVYFLTGQSNMELPVYRTRDVSSDEIDASDYPFIRQYRVTPQFRLAEDKIADLPKLPWTLAVPGDIEQMSAAGFYCAKHIYDEKKVPIGLVLGAQGGSTIESWMSEEDLRDFGDFEKLYSPFTEDGSLQKYLEDNGRRNIEWRGALASDEDAVLCRSIPQDAEDFEVPGLLLTEKGNDYCGIIWLYKEFILNEEPKEDSFLYAGNLIDADISYINGVEVGRTEYRYPPRKYPFSGKLLKKGKNLVAIRLILENGNGGCVAAHPYFVRSGSEKIDLTGTWKMKKGTASEAAFVPGYMGQTIPTSLYKATVRPLKDYAFRGIWWYQGEANSDQPQRYIEKFSAMISCWRKLFRQDLPVISIEMPDYTDPVLGDQPAGWVSIQDQQHEAASAVPQCRVVYARDLTSPWELHPQRKSELGTRMAKEALELYY